MYFNLVKIILTTGICVLSTKQNRWIAEVLRSNLQSTNFLCLDPDVGILVTIPSAAIQA
jgi:hypothetical protein